MMISLRDIKHRLLTPSNHLKIKTLKREYVDADTVLLHSVMQILSEFVENELRSGIVDWDAEPEHKNAKETFEKIYKWWHQDPFARDIDWAYQSNSFQELRISIVKEYKRRGLVDSGYWNWVTTIIRDAENNAEGFSFCLAKIEAAAYDRQNEALKELVDIRGYMWT